MSIFINNIRSENISKIENMIRLQTKQIGSLSTAFALSNVILGYVPNQFYNSQGIIITNTASGTSNQKVYAYIKKGDQIKPITLIYTTYCSMNITSGPLLEVFSGYVNGLTSFSINNIFISAEVYIDCITYQLSIKGLFAGISSGQGYNGQPVTSINTGNSLYDNFLNIILTNNSGPENFKIPTCTFDLSTCDDSCTALVKTINSYISKTNMPSIDLSTNSIAVMAINLLCGNI